MGKNSNNSNNSNNSKFVIIGILSFSILIIVILVIAVIRKDRQSESMQTLGEASERISQSDADSIVDSDSGEASGEEEPEATTAPAAIEEPGESGDPEASGDSGHETKVGALDDEEDPQSDSMAGRDQGIGASVDFSEIGQSRPNVGNIGTELSFGIDVSKYQGTIDWSQVRDSGVEFAMIRVGYRTKVTGVISEDPTARYNLQEAQANGIKIGAYFFSSAVTADEAREEAEFTADIIAKYKITYPVAYNCEDFLSADSRQYGMDNLSRSNMAIAFLDKIAESGYTPMFYASKGEMENNAYWETDALSNRYMIWVAQYPASPYPDTAQSSYTGTHDMWQYTSQGTIAGIINKTDVNVAYFNYQQEASAKDATPAEIVEADPEVGIIFTEVNETVTAKQETNLRNEPSTNNDASIVTRLVHGDTAIRTGIGHNGWSRVIYNGQTLYAVSSYLTTDMNDVGQQALPQGPVYTPVNESVTAKEETNLRTVPSTADPATIVGVLYHGDVLTRIGIGDNGWSQLEYNGQTVYAVSSYLQSAQ